ncbi:IS4 family transposase, partial [Phocaeicola vulgatus]|nr:IS4 family transposase [Phocaeicola vulgatus]
MYQSHRWQEQIKIETITSMKIMLTTWLAKHDKSVLIIFSNLAVTFMLSIRLLLTCAFQSFGRQNSAKRKVVSKCIHYMMWKHRFLHS